MNTMMILKTFKSMTRKNFNKSILKRQWLYECSKYYIDIGGDYVDHLN